MVPPSRACSSLRLCSYPTHFPTNSKDGGHQQQRRGPYSKIGVCTDTAVDTRVALSRPLSTCTFGPFAARISTIVHLRGQSLCPKTQGNCLRSYLGPARTWHAGNHWSRPCFALIGTSKATRKVWNTSKPRVLATLNGKQRSKLPRRGDRRGVAPQPALLCCSGRGSFYYDQGDG